MRKCKGTGKAKGEEGCGKEATHYKYGLCLTGNACFQKWFHHSEAGQEMIIKKSKPIKKVSPKRAKQNREYLDLREAYFYNNPLCEVKLCDNLATDIHHKKGRIGKLLTDTSNFLAVCRKCHQKIELNPTWAKEQGYSKSRLAND